MIGITCVCMVAVSQEQGVILKTVGCDNMAYNELKAMLKRRHISYNTAAAVCGISISNFFKRINCIDVDFKLSEAFLLAVYLRLSYRTFYDIFYPDCRYSSRGSGADDYITVPAELQLPARRPANERA